MSDCYKDLCRLCAQKDEFLEDLFDESNKNVLKLIQDFIQIIVYENDDLPKKICLNCEEKMVSFQQFVLECYKTQESLKNLYADKSDAQRKLECIPQDVPVPCIKEEVKDEMTAEDIVSAPNNEGTLAELEVYDDLPSGDDDDISIATLKQIKMRKVEKKEKTTEDIKQFNGLLRKPNLKIKDFVTFDCEFCGKSFETWGIFRYHYIRVHKRKPVVFCLCGYEISSKSVLFKHVSEHKVESKKIRQAERVEKFQDSEYAHLNVKDFVSFKCTQCQKVCSSWYTLSEHCENEHNILPMVNCSCGIVLKSKSGMYRHIEDHKYPNVFACDKCPRITKSVAALKNHKMRHVPKSERKFCCSSCDKILTTKHALKSHERSHIPIEERKIYHCDICNMRFTTRKSASSHKRVVHDKIKAYVCDLCGYACGTNGELRQHSAIHSDDRPFTCRKCDKSFKTYPNLKAHMDTHEQTSYVCFICQRVLNSRRTLRSHLLVHEDKRRRENRRRLEDKPRHVCSNCNKSFKQRHTLKVHMYTHTGVKPMTCKWCEERFSYASSLRSHRLRAHPDKLASRANYRTRSSHVTDQQNYVKDDVQKVNMPVIKNEVETM